VNDAERSQRIGYKGKVYFASRFSHIKKDVRACKSGKV
jgi:hypothetical protein